jgi:hypothetical protein
MTQRRLRHARGHDLNVEPCNISLDQVLHKRDTEMLCAFGSQSAFGGDRIPGADASRAGAKRSDRHRNTWIS